MIPEIVTAFGFGSKSRFDHFIETNELTLSGSLVLSAILSQQIESSSDMDLYSCREPEADSKIDDILKDFSYKKINVSFAYYDYGCSSIRQIGTYEHSSGRRLQIIYLRENPESYISTCFDLTVVQNLYCHRQIKCLYPRHLAFKTSLYNCRNMLQRLHFMYFSALSYRIRRATYEDFILYISKRINYYRMIADDRIGKYSRRGFTITNHNNVSTILDCSFDMTMAQKLYKNRRKKNIIH
jgi:hypothetical protein